MRSQLEVDLSDKQRGSRAGNEGFIRLAGLKNRESQKRYYAYGDKEFFVS